nr:retrovirus-related Pol polyprotein from transposon 17.6 [Tanacetum cinerariifolium]
MQEVVKKEIVKLLDTGIIYPIVDSLWVSPIYYVPKKGGITVITNENDELVPTRTITESVKVFMDDFSVFGNSFESCLNNLDKMLQHCKDTHIVLNWEKCHFMIKEGIMLRHKVSSVGLEVDKAKSRRNLKTSTPTNIKGIRSFLGHASFYRRFIKDFSKIARPLTKLLEKDTTFEFDDECQKAFELLREKLTCAPVIVSPNWNLLFELMCDASDLAVGAVLGQKDGPYVVKHQYPSGYVELYGKDGKTFTVNCHQLKLYHEEDNETREALTPFFPKRMTPKTLVLSLYSLEFSYAWCLNSSNSCNWNIRFSPAAIRSGLQFFKAQYARCSISKGVSNHMYLFQHYGCVYVVLSPSVEHWQTCIYPQKHKEEFSLKTTDIVGIYQSFYKHKIQHLDDKKLVVQKQRRLNPNMQEVVKKEIMKLLDTDIIYPITDIPWVSPIHRVPKKDGITVVTNKNDELILTRTITDLIVCIDYRKLNEATVKDHFPMLFMDQMLERLVGNK